MTNIYSKQITLESVNEITDWVEPLEKVYARQETQLAQHHQYQRERDAQAEKADSGAVALDTFKNILDFGGKAVQLYQAHKGAQEKKKVDFIKLLNTKEYMLQSADAAKQAAKDYHNGKEDIIKDESQHSYTVRKLRENHPEAAAELEKYSTLQQIAYREWQARQIIPTINEAAFQTNLRQEGNEKALEKYQNTTSELEKRGQWIEWQKEQIAYLKLSDEAFAALAVPEVRRQRSTAEVRGRVQAFQKVASDAERTWISKVKTAALTPETFPGFLKDTKLTLVETGVGIVDQKDHPEGLTREQQADEILYSRLQRLAYDGDLPASAIVNGKDELKYFNQKKINGLVKSLAKGGERRLANELRLDESEEQRIELSQAQGNDESAAIQVLENRGFLPKERISAMKNRSISDQSEAKYQQIMADHKDDIERGRLDPEAIKLITNDKANEALSIINRRIKKADSVWKYKEGTTALQNKINYAQNKKTMQDGGLQPQANEIFTDVEMVRRKAFVKAALAQYDEKGVYTENRNLQTEVGTKVEEYWDLNGGGILNGDGKFSVHGVPGKNGVFKNWRPFTNFQSSRDGNHNVPYNDDFKTRYERKAFDVNGNSIPKETRHAIHEGIFTDEMLVYWSETGKYTEEMQYIATREGEPISDLLKKAYAVVPDDVQKRHNMKLGFEEEKPDKKLQKTFDTKLNALEASKGTEQHKLASQLRAQLRWYGLESFTEPQLNRMYKLLAFDLPANSESVQQARQHKVDIQNAIQAREELITRNEKAKEQYKNNPAAYFGTEVDQDTTDEVHSDNALLPYSTEEKIKRNEKDKEKYKNDPGTYFGTN